MMLQFQRACIPPFEFKQYCIWDDVSFILILFVFLVFYTGCAYYLLYCLKLIFKYYKIIK
jgi:hypothetical protein